MDVFGSSEIESPTRYLRKWPDPAGYRPCLTSECQRTFRRKHEVLKVDEASGTGPWPRHPAAGERPRTRQAGRLPFRQLCQHVAGCWLSRCRKSRMRTASRWSSLTRSLILPVSRRNCGAIASGKYDGIVVCAIYGLGLIPDIEEHAAGIEIVVLNQIVGADLTTSDPQVDGIAASVLASPYRSGVRHGTLTVQAWKAMTTAKLCSSTASRASARRRHPSGL